MSRCGVGRLSKKHDIIFFPKPFSCIGLAYASNPKCKYVTVIIGRVLDKCVLVLSINICKVSPVLHTPFLRIGKRTFDTFRIKEGGVWRPGRWCWG